jgi:hypothetical protein
MPHFLGSGAALVTQEVEGNFILNTVIRGVLNIFLNVFVPSRTSWILPH